MILQIDAVCHVGCVRTNNEDALLIGSEIVRDDAQHKSVTLTGESQPWFAAIADGMGGANAGEIASMMTLEFFQKRMKSLEADLSDETLKQVLTTFCYEIHQAVLDEAARDSSKAGMGTTLTVLLCYGGTFWYLHAGDSRLYRFRDNILTQITRDHSLRELSGNSQVASNIIINSIGGGDTFYVDIGRAGKKIFEGDTYLLCSDGLTDMLSDEEITVAMGQAGFVDDLLSNAKAKGGQDNISYIFINVVESTL